MDNLIVVDNPKRSELNIPGVPVVAARAYLTEAQYSDLRHVKIFNLCRSYRYQSSGYYVSLLAAARGHKPLPSITTIQDMKTLAIARIVADDLDDLIQRSLKVIKSGRFKLSVYFGRNVAKRYEELSSRLFRLFPAPLIEAEFRRDDDRWELQNIGPIAGNDIPESHKSFVIESAMEFFAKNRLPASRKTTGLYDLAILHNPAEETPPSNERALRYFEAAAKRLKFNVEFIEREDFGRIAEFDALFIRETTAVHHHTYRFARRAAAEGLVVIDDPDSIVKCANKVYHAELFTRHSVPTPKTRIVHRDNIDSIPAEVGLPCILKQPDSSFSRGVMKAEGPEQYVEMVSKLLDKSDLVIAQEFMPTAFDWRIGVLDREPLYACRYFMAKEHWQIRHQNGEDVREGNVEPIPLDLVPRAVLQTAVRAARLIGDGLYGVDVKQIGRKAVIMEINDNPNIDAGCEDLLQKEALYDRVMQVFFNRIQQRKSSSPGGRE